MGRVVNWHKYRRIMTPKQREIEDFRIFLQICVNEINTCGQHKDFCIQVLKDIKSQLLQRK